MPAATKTRVHFSCTACGEPAQRWEGRCPSCGEWNSLVEVVGRVAAKSAATTRTVDVVSLGDATPTNTARRSTGIGEVDRVLGAGVVPGSLILLGGDPGIGKSTLALQIAHRLGSATSPALYCAGEESTAQLAMRAARLGCASANVSVLAETDLDTIISAISQRTPPVAIVDSVQTAYDPEIGGVPGSPSQVRAVVARLMACAKETGVSIVLIGHVTKEGAIAGPRTLEHMVDVVLYMEGERHGEHRLLRGIKNRFGSTGELGLFTMTAAGMEELDAPGRAFLDDVALGVSGNVLTVMCEGARALAVEVQALTVKVTSTFPRRAVSGFDVGRLHLLLAVLEKRAQISVAEYDVFANAVGGVRLTEPAVDLAMALAIAGSRRNATLPEATVVLGEIGLGGEVRRVSRMEARLTEAIQLGMRHAVVPARAERLPEGLTYHKVKSIAEAVALLR